MWNEKCAGARSFQGNGAGGVRAALKSCNSLVWFQGTETGLGEKIILQKEAAEGGLKVPRIFC